MFLFVSRWLRFTFSSNIPNNDSIAGRVYSASICKTALFFDNKFFHAAASSWTPDSRKSPGFQYHCRGSSLTGDGSFGFRPRSTCVVCTFLSSVKLTHHSNEMFLFVSRWLRFTFSSNIPNNDSIAGRVYSASICKTALFFDNKFFHAAASSWTPDSSKSPGFQYHCREATCCFCVMRKLNLARRRSGWRAWICASRRTLELILKAFVSSRCHWMCFERYNRNRSRCRCLGSQGRFLSR